MTSKIRSLKENKFNKSQGLKIKWFLKKLNVNIKRD